MDCRHQASTLSAVNEDQPADRLFTGGATLASMTPFGGACNQASARYVRAPKIGVASLEQQASTSWKRL